MSSKITSAPCYAWIVSPLGRFVLLPGPRLLRLAHDFFHALDDIRRLIDDFLRQGLQPFAADRCNLPLALLCFREKFRIFQHVQIGVAEKLHTIRRDARSCQNRPAKSARAQDDSRQPFLRIDSFFLLHQFPDRWRIGQAMITPVARLHQESYKAILGPGSSRLAPKESADCSASAIDLVLLDG